MIMPLVTFYIIDVIKLRSIIFEKIQTYSCKAKKNKTFVSCCPTNPNILVPTPKLF